MIDIKALAEQGFITLTGLVGSDAENMTVEELYAKGWIAKTDAKETVSEIATGGDAPTPSGPQYTITVTGYDEANGTVTGAGVYAAGATVTLVATPTAGHSFRKWKNAYNEEISTDSTLTFVLNDDWISANGYTPFVSEGEPIGISCSMY